MKNVLILMLAFILSSCASHSLNYHKPEDRDGVTTKLISKSFKDAWVLIVEGLAKKNFTIDSLNKESGLIVVSKKLNPPSTYADCGKWDGYFKNLRSNEKYNFQGADSANYMTKEGDVYWAVNRTATLTSKSNIFLKKVENSKTSVSVNTQYKLTFNFNSSANIYPQGRVYDNADLNMEWTSGERGRLGPESQTECVSSFTLESSILDMAK